MYTFVLTGLGGGLVNDATTDGLENKSDHIGAHEYDRVGFGREVRVIDSIVYNDSG